jgi:putative transposase
MRGKPHIERTLESVASLFAQFVSGYTGRSAEFRGASPEKEPLWSMMELQDLLDEWIIAGWQNRRHDGLRDPAAPAIAQTPNEKYAALVEAAGYVPVPLSAEDYIELLPAAWRAVNAYGVKINYRVYDDKDLRDFRGQPSGVTARKNLWEIHYDPYDVSRIWVRNHWNPKAGWVTAFWKHLSAAPAPFGDLAWDYARRQLVAEGKTPTEAEINQAVDAMLRRAHQGPGEPTRPGRGGRAKPKGSAKERRVVARTRATAPPAWPDSVPLAQPPAGGEPPAQQLELKEEQEQDLADVVPLAVFDAQKEARNWW